VKALRSRERDFKSGIIPLRVSKNAFAIGKNNFKKNDALNNIISLIKEKEDSMILSNGKQSFFFSSLVLNVVINSVLCFTHWLI